MKLEKFDYQIGNKRKKNTFLALGLVCLGAFITVILYRTFARYEVTNSYNIIGGKVAKFGIKGVSMYLVEEDGTEIATSIIPKNEVYVFDEQRSNCTNGTEIIYDKENRTLSIDETVGDTCQVYFKNIPFSKQTLYALGLTDDDIKPGEPYRADMEGIAESGFYAAPDNFGTSYYYYNDYSDVHPLVMIDDQSFIIIRINGDGTLRLLSNASWFSEFNTMSNNNAYVGLMFGDINSNNYVDVHSNLNPGSLYDHYINDEGFQSIARFMADGIFCNDRTLYKPEYGDQEEGDTGTGIGTDVTYYGPYYRIRNEEPSLICERKEDSFTVEESEFGNGLLETGVGGLTADELLMTGAMPITDYFGVVTSSISPAYFDGTDAYIYTYDYGFTPVNVSDGGLTVNYVVNLKRGLEFTGTGTWGDEYQIVE